MHSTDCFYSKETGDLTAKAYGSVNSSVSTIAVPLFYRSLGGSGSLRTASLPLAFIPTLNQRLERRDESQIAKSAELDMLVV